MSRIPQSLRDELAREAGTPASDMHALYSARATTALDRLRRYERDHGLDPAVVIDPADHLGAHEPYHFPSGASERTLPLGEYVADEVAGAVPLFAVGDPVEFTDGMGATVWGRIKDIDGGLAFVTEAGDRATWGVGLDRLRRIEHASRPLSPAALDRLEAGVMGGDGPDDPLAIAQRITATGQLWTILAADGLVWATPVGPFPAGRSRAGPAGREGERAGLRGGDHGPRRQARRAPLPPRRHRPGARPGPRPGVPGVRGRSPRRSDRLNLIT
jgi:hypothetical protein